MFHVAAESPSRRPAKNQHHARRTRKAFTACLIAASLSTAGCQICADCDLDSYPTYGGAWQRTTRDSGRVGSIFDPGGARMAELEQRTDPEAADAAMRRRDSGQAIDLPEDPGDGEVEQQFRENQQPPSEADDQRELQDQQDRLRDLQLEEIRKLDGPTGEDWD